MMEAAEFLREHKKMCDSFTSCCDRCPARHLHNCGANTDEPELLADIVSKWAAENSHKVTRADLDQLQNDCETLSLRFSAAIAKIESLIRYAGGGMRYGEFDAEAAYERNGMFCGGCGGGEAYSDCKREFSWEDYALARHLVDAYNGAMTKAMDEMKGAKN